VKREMHTHLAELGFTDSPPLSSCLSSNLGQFLYVRTRLSPIRKRLPKS
jgi:hypothetical protein